MRRRPVVTVAAAVVVLALAAGGSSGARSSALFSAQRVSSANVLGTSSWFFYLHHRPSPAIANTTSAVVDLTMNTSAPTGATLYHLSTDISGDPGRVIQRSAGLMSDTNTKHYEDWWGPVRATAHAYSGTATLTIWAQPRTNNGGATMDVHLRDRNDGTSTVTDITSATYSRPDWSTGGDFSLVTVSLPLTWTLAAGHRFELRIMALNVAKNDQDVILAYDTTTYTATFWLH